MAKSSRSSTRKANNQRLKANVFGPVEAARQERLSARLLEIASQPKPVPENKMGDVEHEGVTEDKASEDGPKTDDSRRQPPPPGLRYIHDGLLQRGDMSTCIALVILTSLLP